MRSHSCSIALALLLVASPAISSAETFVTFTAGPNSSPLPYAINSFGDVTGRTGDPTETSPSSFIRYSNGNIIRFSAPSARFTDAYDINTQGDVTGLSQGTDGVYRGFIRKNDGSIFTFAVPGATFTRSNSINDLGDTTGFWVDTTGFHHGFLRTAAGNYVSFDVPGALDNSPTAINNAGQIAGFWATQTKISGFVRQSSGTIETFDAFGSQTVLPQPGALAENGLIAGTGTLGRLDRGFLRQTSGSIKTFGVPGNFRADLLVESVNSLGQIVGNYATDRVHAFIVQPDGAFVSFDAPGDVVATYAIGINDSGVIVGSTLSNAYLRFP